MRSFAVLAVLFDHTMQVIGQWAQGRWSVIPLGYFAVYLFFVHTTLVLMWSLERQPSTLNFYVRRAFRIYPLAMLVVAVVVLLQVPVRGGPFHGLMRPGHDWRTTVSNFFLFQNLAHTPDVESVLWSLPLEVQMYLALPALFAYARKERRSWPFVTLWAGTAICVFRLSPRVFDPWNIFAFVPNFIPGVIAFVGFMRYRERWPAWTFAVLIAALAGSFIALPSRPMGWTCSLALGVLLPCFRQTASRVLQAIGHTIAKYSYGIYLLHMWGIAIAFHYLHLPNLAAKLAVELLSTAVLSVAGYHLIERPLIDFGGRVAKRVANVRQGGIPGEEIPVP